MAEWQPQVEQRPHPFGEQGVRSSLEEVCKRAAEGAAGIIKDGVKLTKVRTWAGEKLDDARKRGQPVGTPRDRMRVLLEACQKKLWVPDPIGVEHMVGAHMMACDDHGKDGSVCIKAGDCFPQGTLLYTEHGLLVPIEQLREGARIWGQDRWSTVQGIAYKGTLPVDVVHLNNGSQLRLTAEHKVYVLDCPDHPMLDDEDRALPADRNWRDGAGNGCSCNHRVEKRVVVSELRKGMMLRQPERIAFGKNEHPDAPSDHLAAYVEGLFISDGWADYYGDKNSRFFISGQDGCPKEEQKREVERICQEKGINTSWRRKSIAIYGADWTRRVQRMGRYAPEKHALTLDLDEACAAQLLRGIMADSGANKNGGRTLTTTSFLLAVQARVLHRMFGISCGWSYIENHGGLGQNPIWRLSTRVQKRQDGKKAKSLKVKSVDHAVYDAPCWDIQTDDHRVYLPEHDVTVSNCDDITILYAAALCSVGIYTMIVGHGYNGDGDIGHVLAAGYDGRGQWLRGDPSAPDGKPPLPLGECVPFTRERVYSLPEIRVLCDSRNCLDNRRFDPDALGFVTKGTFVGVNGAPELVAVPEGFAWMQETLLQRAVRGLRGPIR